MPWVATTAAAIEEASGGRIQINVLHYGMHPYKPADTLDIMRDRSGDMGFEFNVLLGGVEPLLMAMELPFLLTSQDELYTLLDDPKYADLVKTTFTDILDKYNAFPLCTTGEAQPAVSADVFIDGWDCFKGKRIRTYGSEIPKVIEMLGGTPVAMPYGDVYEALHRGIIDGWVAGFASCVRAKFYEVGGKKVTLTQHSPQLHYIWVNKDAFNELPQDLQSIVLEVGREQTPIIREFLYALVGKAIFDGVNMYDIEFRGVSADFREELRDAMKPIWDSWAEKAGPGAAEIVESLDAFHRGVHED